MNEEQILESIIKEYSWETVLYNIVIAEDMDPWDIDIVKLANAFAKYMKKLKEMDFRIPAKVILTASVFLRMKSEALKIEEEEKKERKKKDEEPLDVSDVPDIDKPAKRKPVRKVTLNELVSALEKAFEVKEKRDVRRNTEQTVIEVEEDNIHERIEDLYNEIIDYIEEKRGKKIPYSKLVQQDDSMKVVKSFLPLLHLMQEGKIDAEQEELYKEIYIHLKNKNDDEEDNDYDDEGREEETD